jgi:hypothetical protein
MERLDRAERVARSMGPEFLSRAQENLDEPKGLYATQRQETLARQDELANDDRLFRLYAREPLRRQDEKLVRVVDRSWGARPGSDADVEAASARWIRYAKWEIRAIGSIGPSAVFYALLTLWFWAVLKPVRWARHWSARDATDATVAAPEEHDDKKGTAAGEDAAQTPRWLQLRRLSVLRNESHGVDSVSLHAATLAPSTLGVWDQSSPSGWSA